MRNILISMILVGCLSFTGCASYLNYKASESEVKAMRIQAAGDRAEIGINVLATDVIKQHPFRTIGAAILDGATMYAIYELTDDDNDSSDDGQSTSTGIPNVTGNNNSILVINGDQNSTKYDTLDQTNNN